MLKSIISMIVSLACEKTLYRLSVEMFPVKFSVDAFQSGTEVMLVCAVWLLCDA